MNERPPSKKLLAALERVFAAEIEGYSAFSSNAQIYRDLLAEGLLTTKHRAPGYYSLTPAGRHLYYLNADRMAGSCRGA